MSNPFPSHKNSTNRRNEIRANWKESVKQILPKADDKLQRQANVLISMKCVVATETGFEVKLPTFQGTSGRIIKVTRAGEKFFCDACTWTTECQHTIAAETLSTEQDISPADRPYRAELRYGTRKGLDFEKRDSFTDKQEAIDWLVRESFNKFMPEGEVTDQFGAEIFKISEEFFELWDQAA